MKKLLIFLVLLLTVSFVSALSSPYSFQGKRYYVVTSTDPTEDSGDEVCAKAGMSCVGYTVPTNTICKTVHPSAADSSSMSGDLAGVYCDGIPQNGVCSTKQNTCHTCPACTNTVSCSQAIGNLYREMYVECSAGSCKISLTVNNVNDFINQIPGLNSQIQACPQQLPSGASLLIGNGNTVVNIKMNNGNTVSVTVVIANGKITGIRTGGGTCTQQVSITENDFNSILSSSNPAKTVAFLVAQKKIVVSGCSWWSRIKFFFVRPIARIVAGRQAPTAPPPKPAPNCGQVGEQCNNRACWSGICGAPRGNTNGNYQCLAQSDWNSRCQGYGNTPAPWNCITGPCR